MKLLQNRRSCGHFLLSAYLKKVFRVQTAGQELTVWAVLAQRPLIHPKAHAGQDNVHLAASLLSVVTDGISSRQHIMYMYTFRQVSECVCGL